MQNKVRFLSITDGTLLLYKEVLNPFLFLWYIYISFTKKKVLHIQYNLIYNHGLSVALENPFLMFTCLDRPP